jgi:polyphosphate kinase
MQQLTKHVKNREISWLSFNARVLQEAQDKSVPLIERIKFLGIFSSNLDEFFRVRVANLRRMLQLVSLKKESEVLFSPQILLNDIQGIVLSQQVKFDRIYKSILKELEEKRIFIINEEQLNVKQAAFVRNYFQQKVLSYLMPVMLDKITDFPFLKDRSIYLVVRLSKKKIPGKYKHALIEIPSKILSRFVVLPKSFGNNYIVLLDDVIRYCLKSIFYIFNFDHFEAWTIKLTRDAELEFDTDYIGNFRDIISNSLKQRKKGIPVRFNYDADLPKELLEYLVKRMHLDVDALLPGGRYHNFKDFSGFPDIGSPDLVHKALEPLKHKDLMLDKSILKSIQKKDCMLHFPYQSFDYVINFLREASIDPKVVSIKMTLYRVSQNSNVVNALINAVKNGKHVTVIMELQARFDEESNIMWAKKLEEAGAKVLYGIPGMKVHCKLCLITRIEKGKPVLYANLGSGNYNGVTARLYCDHSLFTMDKRLTNEVAKVFKFLESKKKIGSFKHLIVAPLDMRKRWIEMINTEIKNAKSSLPCGITVKLNHLVDPALIEKLYEASIAGVKVNIIARSTCTLDANIPTLSENIKAISLVDKLLEHARVFIFNNGGKPKYFVSSADWMTRNMDFRIEVAFPIYDKEIQDEIQNIIDIQLHDNVKARILDEQQSNIHKHDGSKIKVRAQAGIYNFLKKNHPNKTRVRGIRKIQININ